MAVSLLRRNTRKFIPTIGLLRGIHCAESNSEVKYPQKVNLDWDSLGFAYRPTDSIRVHKWTAKSGWSVGESRTNPVLNLSPMCPALHYGQQAFEGLKAFETAEGEIGIFHPENANAHRMKASCNRMVMPEIHPDLFNEAIINAVKDNARWIPPYRKGSLYIRPFIIGSGSQLGLAPASEYEFIVCVMPVGNYYSASTDGLKALVVSDFDRAAARGTGAVKVGGNYGADLLPNKICKAMEFDTCLYVDSLTQKFVEEFSVSNLAGITEDGKYITPESDSVLPSVTNTMLMKLAQDSGIEVERRPVAVTELEDFVEVAALGTAVTVNPVASITHNETCYSYHRPTSLLGLRDKLVDIQYGDAPDTYDWIIPVDVN